MTTVDESSPELNAELEASLPKLSDPELHWVVRYEVSPNPQLFVKLYHRTTKKSLILRKERKVEALMSRWQGAIHYIYKDEKRKRNQLFFAARGMALKIIRGDGLQ